MNIVINNKSDIAIYEQIYSQIANQILTGELPDNFQLPSIRNIALELKISVITIKKAWDMLEANGLIYTKSAIGCFVQEHSKSVLKAKKENLAKEKLLKDIPYYIAIGVSKEELLLMIEELFPSNH